MNSPNNKRFNSDDYSAQSRPQEPTGSLKKRCIDPRHEKYNYYFTPYQTGYMIKEYIQARCSIQDPSQGWQLPKDHWISIRRTMNEKFNLSLGDMQVVYKIYKVSSFCLYCLL